MIRALSVLLILIVPTAALAQQTGQEDPWKQLNFLEGTWEGQGTGMSGNSTVTQTYEYVLNGTFLRMQTRAVFEPTEKNPDGEIHEDFAIISYDGARKIFVMRAFYVEGFVNTYVLGDPAEDGKALTFETEAVENAPAGTKAKLVFTKTSEGEIEQGFFVAFPGQDLSCFSTNKLKKK